MYVQLTPCNLVANSDHYRYLTSCSDHKTFGPAINFIYVLPMDSASLYDHLTLCRRQVLDPEELELLYQ